MEAQHSVTLSWEALTSYEQLPESNDKKVKWMGKYLRRCIDSQPYSNILIQIAGNLFVRAEEERNANVVAAFKSLCADPRVKTYVKQRFLLSAKDGNDFQCVSFWKLLGNDLFNCVDQEQNNCAHLAALVEDTSAIHFMIKKKPELQSMVNLSGRTALFVAVEKGYLSTVLLLLQSGSDRIHQDKNGSTPLHVAVEKGHFDIVKVLAVRNDGEPSSVIQIKDNKGIRPVDLAQRRAREYPHIFSYLDSFSHVS